MPSVTPVPVPDCEARRLCCFAALGPRSVVVLCPYQAVDSVPLQAGASMSDHVWPFSGAVLLWPPGFGDAIGHSSSRASLGLIVTRCDMLGVSWYVLVSAVLCPCPYQAVDSVPLQAGASMSDHI